MPTAQKSRRAFLARVVVSALILTAFYFVLVWNMRQTNADPSEPVAPTFVQTLGGRMPLPEQLGGAGKLVGIDQIWTMFAPSPPMENGWFVVVGRLTNGKDVDLLRGGGEVSWEKPPLVSATIPNGRWQKYLENLSTTKFKPQLRFYSRFLCRQWNESHAETEQVRMIQIYWMGKTTFPDRISEPERKSLSIHICTDKTPPGTHAIESPGE